MNGWRERIDFEFTFKWFQADFIRYLLLGAECTKVGGSTGGGDAGVVDTAVGDACVGDAVRRGRVLSGTRASGTLASTATLRCLQLKYYIK